MKTRTEDGEEIEYIGEHQMAVVIVVCLVLFMLIGLGTAYMAFSYGYDKGSVRSLECLPQSLDGCPVENASCQESLLDKCIKEGKVF